MTSRTLAAPDAARGVGPGPVAEIVRFKLLDGVSDAAFLTATAAMQSAVAAAPGFLSRRLSKGEGDVWTDYVIWTDLDHALAAASEVFKDPAAEAFGAAIDHASIDMRHEPILWQPE
jgi:hypothetical protein